ncbi:amino acid ABC transporter ATP-binding protein [Helicobacter mustelae]|uniref:amino acid ABC transporter ATP-binding protein n=1 Tax=Helicobacter mustelae TaxID=217 RepID=UPI000DFB4337|nr:amino acid ABC transporter ATP-binding protein [Helicobacter mustelae]STP12251.1 amino acid ABC transporter ATP-binding protein [Helicobacter mustelae]
MSIVLETKKLVKFYQENQIVLNGLDVQIKKGEVVVILGVSGCGKSTFLRCLNGLESIQGGEIWLDGRQLDLKNDWHGVRQKVGMVFQNYELFPHIDVLENVLLAPLKVQKRQRQEVEEEAIVLLTRMGLKDKIHAMPKQLSGGQKQRVAIARALCTNPEVLLLDEITASLDPEMVKEVLEIVLELAKDGMTMVIVTHELKFASMIADRILFFEKGNILANLPPKEFFTQSGNDRIKKFLSIFEF